MEIPIIVEYKYKNKFDPYGDLICPMTEYFDKYIPYRKRYSWYKTYLYNDIGVFSDKGLNRIAFRVPGATRGCIDLERINNNQFLIINIHFNEDCCFGNIGCYKRSILKASQKFIGKILDFSNVKLLNNIH